MWKYFLLSQARFANASSSKGMLRNNMPFYVLGNHSVV